MLPSPIERTHTFESLADDVIAVCRSVATTTRVARGHILFKGGDPARTLFVILEGFARITSVSPDGHEVVAAFAGPRDVLGLRAALKGSGSYLVTAVATSPMELRTWTRSQAMHLRQHFPAVHAYLDEQAVRNADAILKRLHTLSEGKAAQRLAKALVELSERHGRRERDGISLPLPLTRQDLAALTGTTIYTASRILADWVDADILESSRARLRVKQLNRLIQLSRA